VKTLRKSEKNPPPATFNPLRISHGILVGKPEGRTPLGTPRRRWVDNIKMDLREIGWDSVDWVDLAQDRDSGGLL
jgi:hypothetical protein